MKTHKKAILYTTLGFVFLALLLSLLSFINYTIIKDLFTQEGNRHTFTVNADECDHEFGIWQIENNPTSTLEGLIYRKCGICSYAENSTLPIINTENYTKESILKPTCTMSGKDKYTTYAYNQEFSIEIILSPLGHEYSEDWEILLDPTCIDSGLKAHKCLNCESYSSKIEISPTGHTYSSDYTIDKYPTCEISGKKSRHCLKCNNIADITTIAPLGHHVIGITLNKLPNKLNYREGEHFESDGLEITAICSRPNCTGYILNTENLTANKDILTKEDNNITISANIDGKEYSITLSITVEKYKIRVDSNAISTYQDNYDGKIHSFGIDKTKILSENNEKIEIYCSLDNIAWSKEMFFQSRDVIKKLIYWKISAKDCEDIYGSTIFEIKKAQAKINLSSNKVESICGEKIYLPEPITNLGEVSMITDMPSTPTAGKYTVRYVIEETNNYYGDSKSIEVTIKAKYLATNYTQINKNPCQVQGEIDAKNGFDPTAKIIIKSLNSTPNSIAKVLPNNKIVSNSYNATIYINNTPSNINDEVTIKFEKPINITTNTCTIVINEQGKLVQKLAYAEDNYLVFKSSTLGDFVIIVDKATSKLNMLMLLIIAPITIAFLITLILAIIKLKKSK